MPSPRPLTSWIATHLSELGAQGTTISSICWRLGLLRDQVTLMMEGSSSFGVCDPAGD